MHVFFINPIVGELETSIIDAKIQVTQKNGTNSTKRNTHLPHFLFKYQTKISAKMMSSRSISVTSSSNRSTSRAAVGSRNSTSGCLSFALRGTLWQYERKKKWNTRNHTHILAYAEWIQLVVCECAFAWINKTITNRDRMWVCACVSVHVCLIVKSFCLRRLFVCARIEIENATTKVVLLHIIAYKLWLICCYIYLFCYGTSATHHKIGNNK